MPKYSTLQHMFFLLSCQKQTYILQYKKNADTKGERRVMIYITGDTHAEPQKFVDDAFPEHSLTISRGLRQTRCLRKTTLQESFSRMTLISGKS